MHYKIIFSLSLPLLLCTMVSRAVQQNNKKSHYVRWTSIDIQSIDGNTIASSLMRLGNKNYIDLKTKDPIELQELAEYDRECKDQHIPCIIAQIESHNENQKFLHYYKADTISNLLGKLSAVALFKPGSINDFYRVPIQKIDYFIKTGKSFKYLATSSDLQNANVKEIFNPKIIWYNRLLRLATYTKDDKRYLKVALHHPRPGRENSDREFLASHLAKLYKDINPEKALLYNNATKTYHSNSLQEGWLTYGAYASDNNT